MPERTSGRPRARNASLIFDETGAHLEGRLDRVQRVVGLRHRRAEDGHDRVADELVDHAMMLHHALDHAAEVLVQEVEQRARLHRLADAGERADVREEHGDRHELAAERHVALHQVVGDLARHVAPEGLAQPIALAQALDHRVEVDLARLSSSSPVWTMGALTYLPSFT